MSDQTTLRTDALDAGEEARVRRRVADIVRAEWGDVPDTAYHPEELCQSDRDLVRLLATMDARAMDR